MLLGEFGTKPCSDLLQTSRIDHALTGHVGVESGCEIATTPSVYFHKHVGILGFRPSFLQYTQPRRNYQNDNPC